MARSSRHTKDVVLRVRDIVLDADPRIEETIKWQAPTFHVSRQPRVFVMKIATVAEANKAKPDIEKIVRAWCDWKTKP